MPTPRWMLAALIAGVGALQAWDSRILHAEPFVQLIVAAGILLLAAVVWSPRIVVRFSAVIISSALMIGGRMMSDVRLPELGLAAFFPAIILWLDTFTARRAACARPR